MVGQLRSLIGFWPAGVRQPEIAQTKEAPDLALNVDLGEKVTHVAIVGKRLAVARRRLTVIEQPLPEAIAAQPAAAAVLKLEVRARHPPAVVLTAHQRGGGDAHAVEEDRLL